MTVREKDTLVLIREFSQGVWRISMTIKTFMTCLMFTQTITGSATAQLYGVKPNYPPGTLARDRLGPMGVDILTGATRVEVQRKRWERGTDLVGEGDLLVTISRE